MKIKYWLGVIMAVVSASYTLGYKLGGGGTETVPVLPKPVTVIDTVYKEVAPVEYQALKAEHKRLKLRYQELASKGVEIDTVYVKPDSSGLYDIQTAYVDTTLERDGIKYGDLAVTYFFEPIDDFSIDFWPAKLPEITMTVTKYQAVPVKWYKRPYVTIPASIAAGYIVNELIK